MRFGLVVLFLVNLLNFYDRLALGAVLEPIRREFGLNDTQLGALMTFFTLIYAVAGVPLGRLADKGSRRTLLACGMAVWAALTAVAGMSTTYAMLLVSRLGVGAGEAVCGPAASSWIGDLVPAEKRARALAFFMTAVPIGGMLSFSIGGPVALRFGWRTALVVAAAPALLLLPALLAIREPERGAAERKAWTGGVSPWELARIPTLWWITLSGAVVNFALYAVSTFLPTFLMRCHGLSLAGAGLWAGIGSGVAGVAGGLGAAWIGDRAIRRRPNGRMLAAAVAALAAAPAALVGIAMPGGAVAGALTGIMLAYGLLSGYYGLVYSSIHDVVAPQLRATAMAVYFMAMYLCGASFGPLLTGRLSDTLAARAREAGMAVEAARAVGLQQAMYVVPALSLVLALVLWAGSRTIERDTR
jgi:predicted MFS family arabinose efflux permease